MKTARFPAVTALAFGGALFASLPLRGTGRADDAINLRRTVTVQVVERTKDAVVNISTTKLISRRVSPVGEDPFWQQFGFGDVERVPASSLGSGFEASRSGTARSSSEPATTA